MSVTTKRLESAIQQRLENRAFHDGLNAAIQGLDYHSNPFEPRITPTLAFEWDRGFEYVVDQQAAAAASRDTFTNFLQTI